MTSWRRGPSAGLRTGIAVPIIVVLLFVLGTMILAFNTYSSRRVRATGALLNSFSALAAAEAGINCVLMEIRNSQGWITHELKLDAQGEFEWGEKVARPVRLSGDSELTVENNRDGTYQGKIGSGIFGAEFKVRVGLVPLKDDANTPAVDESNRFVMIESIGKKADPTKTQDRFTRLRVIGEVSNFTEYVTYDGEKVVLGMGSENDAHHTNVFANGRLYGHEGVLLGDIKNNGTKQRFVHLDALRSGGNILLSDSYQVTFQKPQAMAGVPVELGSENDSDGPMPLETASGNVLDGKRGGALTLPPLDKEFYRKQAGKGGIDVSAQPLKPEYIPAYEGELPAELIELDFGQPGYDGSPAQPDDKEALGQDYPGDFNGLIYSSKPVTVWGCPDRDVTIFCEGDIFISGDFNIHPNRRQNYKESFETPDDRKIEGTPFYQYLKDEDEKWLDSSGEPVDGKDRERAAVALISMGRIWFDYRHPARFLANELKGLVKWEIVRKLTGDDDKAYEFVKYKDAGANPQPIPAAQVTSPGADGQDTLAFPLLDYFGQSGGGNAAEQLRVTTESFPPIRQAFVDAVADGELSREDLDGEPGKPGILDVINKALAADEPKYASFHPTANGGSRKDSITPPELGAFTAPQRLYSLVFDEESAPLTSAVKAGKYSDKQGKVPEFLKDELYMPQISMYAMIFTAAKRNDAEGQWDDPKSMDRHFDDLGNGRGKAVHYLTSMHGLQCELTGSGFNITTPLVQRFVGSEIRLAKVDNHPPALKDGKYWPPLRRRIYDRTLAMHPPPLIPQQIELRSWQQFGAVKSEWEGF